MKKDQKQTIRAMDTDLLNKRLDEIVKQLIDFKMQLNTGKLKNVHSMKALKKELAFIKTIQTQKKFENK
jgi:ribosomal protein L29